MSALDTSCRLSADRELRSRSSDHEAGGRSQPSARDRGPAGRGDAGRDRRCSSWLSRWPPWSRSSPPSSWSDRESKRSVRRTPPLEAPKRKHRGRIGIPPAALAGATSGLGSETGREPSASTEVRDASKAFNSRCPCWKFPLTAADELAFAERAALYLEKQGLDHRTVVQVFDRRARARSGDRRGGGGPRRLSLTPFGLHPGKAELDRGEVGLASRPTDGAGLRPRPPRSRPSISRLVVM